MDPAGKRFKDKYIAARRTRVRAHAGPKGAGDFGVLNSSTERRLKSRARIYRKDGARITLLQAH